MRITPLSVSGTLLAVLVSGCFDGTGSGLVGINGGNGGNGNNSPPVLAFFVQPNSADVGQIITPVEVVARDSLGGTDTSFTGSITISLASNSTGASLSGTTAVRPASGIATFSNLAIDKAGTYTLQASTSGATPVVSNAFTINAPTP